MKIEDLYVVLDNNAACMWPIENGDVMCLEQDPDPHYLRMKRSGGGWYFLMKKRFEPLYTPQYCTPFDKELIAEFGWFEEEKKEEPKKPEPFRVTGLGKYKTRNGDVATISKANADQSVLFKWIGTTAGRGYEWIASWDDKGRFLPSRTPHDFDLVERIETPDRIVCKHCNAEWINNYTFCPSCGFKLK